MISSYTINSHLPGPHVLVLGAVHGNEQCGTVAIRRLLQAFADGSLSLVSGQVTFVPITNPQAFAASVRYVEQNLNRVMRPTAEPDSYEGRLANHVCTLIQSCDVLLDLHSFTGEGEPFAFVDYPTSENLAFMQALQLPYSLENWPELYAANDQIDSYDTERYAHTEGKVGITVECGGHGEPQSVTVAYETIIRTLEHTGLLTATQSPEASTSQRISVEQVIVKEAAGGQLSQMWQNFTPIEAGQLVATRASGEQIISEFAGCIILPKPHANPGDEFFYLGKFITG